MIKNDPFENGLQSERFENYIVITGAITRRNHLPKRSKVPPICKCIIEWVRNSQFRFYYLLLGYLLFYNFNCSLQCQLFEVWKSLLGLQFPLLNFSKWLPALAPALSSGSSLLTLKWEKMYLSKIPILSLYQTELSNPMYHYWKSISSPQHVDSIETVWRVIIFKKILWYICMDCLVI